MKIATPLRNLCSILVLFSLGGLHAQNSFSKQQVLEDMDFLKSSLEETHYNLYAYTPKQVFDNNFNTVRASIKKDSLNLLEVTNLFQRVISKADNGHTEIDFPAQSYIEYAYGGGTVFPLELAFEDGRALVRRNWSGNDSIATGSEVLGINGVSIAEILENIYPQVSAERPYFKNVKIELYSFPRYYWQVFGRQDIFEVKIRSGKVIQKFTVSSVSAIDGYEARRTEILNAERGLKFFGPSAYLNPGDLSGDLETFQEFVDSAFVKIKKRGSKNLIIDLRNNKGGDDAFSDYLVSYLADHPFKWNSSFTLKTSALLKEDTRRRRDTTTVFWQEVLRHKNGEVYDYPFEPYDPQPKTKRFPGKVYVLVNRQSHSQSAVTAAQIQDYGFGTLAGEETGKGSFRTSSSKTTYWMKPMKSLRGF
ncbi:MAG: S41 family peptidase [Robiginitalea sp.]